MREALLIGVSFGLGWAACAWYTYTIVKHRKPKD